MRKSRSPEAPFFLSENLARFSKIGFDGMQMKPVTVDGGREIVV